VLRQPLRRGEPMC